MSFHVIYEDPDYDYEDEFEYEDLEDEFVSIDDIDPDSLSYDPFDTVNS